MAHVGQPWRKYRVTSPDGRAFEVTAPEGASEQEVLAYAQANYQSSQPERSSAAATGAPIEVDLPDGTVVEFPAGTSRQTMETALRQYHAQQPGPWTKYQDAAENPLAKFKAQNPAYANVPDDDLADALHRKFYASMPRDEFQRRATKAKPWAEVANSPAYRALPQHEQEAARIQYFERVVSPQLASESDRSAARAQFDRETGLSQPGGGYTEDQLFAKLERADAAGDTEAAKVIADEIRSLRADSATPPTLPPKPKAGATQPTSLETSLRGVLNGDLQAGVRQGLKQAAYGAGQLVLEGGPGGIIARKLGQYLGADSDSGLDPLHDAAMGLGALAKASGEAFDRSRAGQNYAGQGGRMIGQTAPAMLIPGGQATIGARGTMAALGGATAGGLQPVTGGDYAAQKGAQVAQGGVLGLLGQVGLGEPARFAAGRLAALATGGKANVSAAAQAALDYAKKHGLPIYADDVLGSPTARGAGVFVDDVPVIGGAGRRRAQSEAAAGHAREFAARYPAQGPNAAQTLAQSAEAQLQRARGIKSKLYDDAFGKLNQAGEFALLQTRQAARQLIAAERAKGTLADTGLIAELGKYVDAPRFNFEGWHGVRAELGNLIRSKRTGDNALLSDRAGFVLSSLKARMDAELTQAAQRIGGPAANAWKAADKFYREVMPKYRRGTVAAMLKSPDPDAIANRILGGRDSGNIARQVYGALDKQGRAEVRSALVTRALERAMKQSDGGEAVFNPGAFAKELDGVSERTAVFFSKSDRAELDGLRNYMSFVRNSGHYASNPQTGRRLITHLAIMGGSGAAGVAAPATYAGVTVAARALLRTEGGRNLLLRMGSVSPQSKAAEQTAQLIGSYLQRQAASEQAREWANGR